MNNKIRIILNTHLCSREDDSKESIDNALNNAILEICELQILQCHKQNNSEVCMNILNTKNIAK